LSSISVCLVSSLPFRLLISLFSSLLNIPFFVPCEVSSCCVPFAYFEPLTPLLSVPLRTCDLPFTKPHSDKQPSQVLLFNLPHMSVHRGHLCSGRQVSQQVTCRIDSRDVGVAGRMLWFILGLFNDAVQKYNNKPPLQLWN
jgi:hypothetical protein